MAYHTTDILHKDGSLQGYVALEAKSGEVPTLLIRTIVWVFIRFGCQSALLNHRLTLQVFPCFYQHHHTAQQV